MGARGIKLDRRTLTFFSFCMLILAISIICFEIKNKERIEAFDYNTFENCAMYIKHNSAQKSDLEFAEKLNKLISANKIFTEDVPELKLECSTIVMNIQERQISQRVVIYQYEL